MKEKLCWLVATVVLLSNSASFADQKKDQRKVSAGEQPSFKRSEEITPPASPIASEGVRFFFSGDFIYWQPKMDNLVVGYTGAGDTVRSSGVAMIFATNPSQTGVIQLQNFNYQPGFKFGSGLVFAYDGWDTWMQYTWIQSTQQTTTINSSATTGLLQSFFFNQNNTNSYANSVTGNWSFYFNEMDWELGRKFFLSKYLVVRPHMGLKGAWFHQGWNLNEQGSITGALTINDASAQTFQRQKFWGIGFRGGINTEFHICKDFSLYGNVAFTEIYGLMHLKVTSQVNNPNLNDIAPKGFIGNYCYLRQNIHTMKPILEMAMGFRYEPCFGDDDYYRFLLQVGWEQQTWWDQNQLLKMINVSTAGDNNLVFQGLDVKVGFYF